MKITAAVVLATVLCLFVVPFSAAPQSNPLLSIDYPVNYPTTTATVSRTFGIWGTALNSDVVHVWGFPPSGAIFMGAAYTNGGHIMKQTDVGSFSLVVRDAPVGTYPVVIYARDPSTGTFPTQFGITMTVQACTNPSNPWINWPFQSPSGQVSVALAYCGL